MSSTLADTWDCRARTGSARTPRNSKASTPQAPPPAFKMGRARTPCTRQGGTSTPQPPPPAFVSRARTATASVRTPRSSQGGTATPPACLSSVAGKRPAMRQGPKAKAAQPEAGGSRARARGAELARKWNMLAEADRGACLQKFGVDLPGHANTKKPRKSPFSGCHKEQPEEEPEEQAVEQPEQQLVVEESEEGSISPAVRRSSALTKQTDLTEALTLAKELMVALDFKPCTGNASRTLTRTAPSLPLQSLAQVTVAEATPKSMVCTCGNVYVADAVFCRRCGTKRPSEDTGSKTPFGCKTPTCNSLELTDTVLRKSELLLAELTASLEPSEKDDFCLRHDEHKDVQSTIDESESRSCSSCSSPIAQAEVSNMRNTVEVPVALLDMLSTTLSNYQHLQSTMSPSKTSFDGSESCETQAPESEPESCETEAPGTPKTLEDELSSPESSMALAATSCQTTSRLEASRCMSPQRAMPITQRFVSPSVRRAASPTVSPPWWNAAVRNANATHSQRRQVPANVQLYRQASPAPRVHRIQAPAARQALVPPSPLQGCRPVSCKIKAQEITTITKSVHLTVEIC